MFSPWSSEPVGEKIRSAPSLRAHTGGTGLRYSVGVKTFKPYNPNQLFLLPPAIRDWLPEGHLALFL